RAWAPAGAACAGLHRWPAHQAPARRGDCPGTRAGSGLGVVFFLGLGRDRGGELLAQGGLDPGGHRRVVLEVLTGVLLALADALAVTAVPGAGLLDQLGIHAHVDDLALAADALAVEDLGDDLLERRRHLVLDHLDLGLVADDLVALLDRTDAADVQAHRGVELQRIAAGGGFRTLARHHDA